MHRFYLERNDLGQSEVEIFEEDFVFQILKVLRFREKESLILFNSTGKNFEYEITGLSKKSVRVVLKNINDNLAVSKRKIRLFMAMTKHMEKFELVLQKCTEIGVSEFFPLISQRTERRLLEKKERLIRILKEATEQSGGDLIPLLHEEVILADELNKKDRGGFLPIFADLNGHDFSSGDFTNFNNIDLFIGPEGGFSDEECVAAKNAGFNCIKFGNRVLRAETAGISISGLFLL